MGRVPLSFNAAYRESTQPPRVMTCRTQLTKSIPITCKKGKDESYEDGSLKEAERMYDCATWRMYNRITNSRKGRILIPAVQKNGQSEKNQILISERRPGVFVATENHPHNDNCSNDWLAATEDQEEEEFFQLDL